MLRLALAIAALLFSCSDDDGPNSEHCVKVRMQYIEIQYGHDRAARAGAADWALSSLRQMAAELRSANLKCFP